MLNWYLQLSFRTWYIRPILY